MVGRNVTIQIKLIALYHDSAARGHLKTTVMTKRVASGFYWKGQQKHIRQYIRECPIYQLNKLENTRTLGLL